MCFLAAVRTLGPLWLALTAACGSEDVTVTSGSGGVTTLLSSFQNEREVLLLAVDDGSDAVAVGLRSALLDALAHYDADSLNRLGICVPQNDPAWWRPVDRRVVVVLPSQSGMARFISPLDDPALVWAEPNATAAGQAAWVAAIARALDSVPSPDGPYRLLEATHDAMALLGGDVAPASPAEAELVEALITSGTGVPVIVATGRDDQSPLPPEQYAFPFDSARSTAVLVQRVIVPAESAPAERLGCYLLPSDPAPARVASWADQMLAGYLAGWPCNELSLATGLFADCRAGTSWVPTRRATLESRSIAGMAQPESGPRSRRSEPFDEALHGLGWLVQELHPPSSYPRQARPMLAGLPLVDGRDAAPVDQHRVFGPPPIGEAEHTILAHTAALGRVARPREVGRVHAIASDEERYVLVSDELEIWAQPRVEPSLEHAIVYLESGGDGASSEAEQLRDPEAVRRVQGSVGHHDGPGSPQGA